MRDYGRLGVLLANDGAVGGRQVVPKDYLLEATDWHRQPDAFAPRRATPYFGYGYQFWLFPGEKRRFALLGVYGQSIFVDPELKLVMVITAAAKNASVGKESFGRGARRAVARAGRQIRKLVAMPRRDPMPPAIFFFGPSRGMHFRARTIPVAVIWAPETSLIWPAGHDPSSTRMRWPSRKSTMSCSRDTCSRHRRRRQRAQREAAEQREPATPDGRELHGRAERLSHLFWIFSPFGPTLICRPSGSFLVW